MRGESDVPARDATDRDATGPVPRRRFLAGAAAVAGSALTAGATPLVDPERNRARLSDPAAARVRAEAPTVLDELARLAGQAGEGEPCCLIDLGGVEHNLDALLRFAETHGWTLRPRLDVLGGPQPAARVLDALPEPRGLVRRLRDVAPTLEAAPEEADLIVAEAPTDRELARYLTTPPTRANQRVRLSVGDLATLDTTIDLAHEAGTDEPVELCLELDSGAGRGGFREPQSVVAAAGRLRDAGEVVRCTALRARDTHARVTAASPVRTGIARDARARLRELRRLLVEAAGGAIDPDELVVGGPGSANYRNWAEGDELDEIHPGSAVVYSRWLREGFDDDELVVALVVAAPVLGVVGASPRVPLTDFSMPGSDREQLTLRGGSWPDARGEQPELLWPEGLDDDRLHGGRGEHTSAITAPAGRLERGDYVLMWPEDTDAAVGRFGSVIGVREGTVEDIWPTFTRWGAPWSE
ncbi:alanine racemase [Egibacter rhizosphaerae]|uniref:alanine racemase n=1 Tax=Egibacter rhizosphaerae TaxID=1670831 RepID=UPI0013F15F97|nr:alanine racemase [Egibacter rhizosphaerae]